MEEKKNPEVTLEGRNPTSTPRMNQMFAFAYDASDDPVMYGYYGDLSFLDSHSAFIHNFGNSPQLLSPDPTKADSIDVIAIVRTYLGKYRFAIFIHVCRQDYVGSSAAYSSRKAVAEVFQYINTLTQEFIVLGKPILDTPNVYFGKLFAIL